MISTGNTRLQLDKNRPNQPGIRITGVRTTQGPR